MNSTYELDSEEIYFTGQDTQISQKHMSAGQSLNLNDM